MKNVKFLLAAVAFLFAFAGAFATKTLSDPALRGLVDAECVQIQCTTIQRPGAEECKVETDDQEYYAPSDTNCEGEPVPQAFVRINE